MKKNIIIITALVILCIAISCTQKTVRMRRITLNKYIDKMKAGWIGQMVGVGWGGPTEFKWQGDIIPLDSIPEWKPEMVNQHYQDDIYVEMTFLRTLEQYGFDVSIRQAGIDFANSKYMLWHANRAGRDNLRSGIAPPYSGHPAYNAHADDIDYQIEADYSGLIAPGMPQIAIDLGEKFGRLMNYGDGLYGGQFVAGMYAEAFFESDIAKIIQAGLACIPPVSMYHECISDVIKWHRKYPNDWKKTWQLIDEKYQRNPEYRKFSCSGADSDFNIDAKINGAYIVMGLLYGKGDPDSTIVISTRCGQDSDCNPSSAAGILFTTIGFSRLPERFRSDIENETKFSFTEYNFPGIINVCDKLVRQAVIKAGGRIEKNAIGEEELVIPDITPNPGLLEQCWESTPVTEDVNFTKTEMDQITIRMRHPDEFIKVWQLSGPYIAENANSAESLFDMVFNPEIPSMQTKVGWRTINLGQDGLNKSAVQLHDIFGGENRVAYLRTKVFSPAARNAQLELGTDDGIKLWVNGILLFQKNVLRAYTAGEDKVAIHLQQGWNTLFLKITQGSGGWEASACLCDESGNVLKDVIYKPD